MTKAIESRSQAFKRITSALRNYANHSVGAMKLIQEAKALEIWKEKYSSWREYCEKEFGQSRQHIYKLLDTANTVKEIQSVAQCDTESAKNKEILANLTSRQAAELKGLQPEEKAKVFNLAIEAEGGKAPKPITLANARSAAQLPPRRRSSFDPDLTKRNYGNPYSSNVDPADKIPNATPEDVVVARAVVLPIESTPDEVFPQMFSFELHDQDEKDSFRVFSEKILVKREKKKRRPKINMRDAVVKVKEAYKRVKGKELSVKPKDAGQLRRHLESGMTLEEFIEVAEKAWASEKWWARNQSHQLASFVKHFGTIREEINGSSNGVDKNQIRETIHVRSL